MQSFSFYSTLPHHHSPFLQEYRVSVRSFIRLFIMASQSMEIMAKALEQQVLQSARMVEEQLDKELGKLERMDDDEMEKLKERRMEALKKSQKQKQVGGKDSGHIG